MVELLYSDDELLVCLKPVGVASESGENGLPTLLEKQTGRTVYPVHRLDTGVGGIMVYALNASCAAALSAQIQRGEFVKRYLAVVRGVPEEGTGTYTDLLFHDRRSNKSFVTDKKRAGVKTAVLDYGVLQSVECDGRTLSLLQIRLHTGRTHQIRVQFASRGMPLYGDGKYGGRTEKSGIALFSHSVCFTHPTSGEGLCFSALPPQALPWALFSVSEK